MTTLLVGKSTKVHVLLAVGNRVALRFHFPKYLRFTYISKLDLMYLIRNRISIQLMGV